MYNLLTVNIMDIKKFQTVQRFFSLSETSILTSQGQVYHYLHMYSVIDGDFGQVTLSTAALIDSPAMEMNVKFVKDCAQSQDVLFALRSQEVRYFLEILSLFNPLNQLNYEKVSSSSESPEF